MLDQLFFHSVFPFAEMQVARALGESKHLNSHYTETGFVTSNSEMMWGWRHKISRDAIATYGFSSNWSKNYCFWKYDFIDSAEELKSTTDVSQLPETKPMLLTTLLQGIQYKVTLF